MNKKIQIGDTLYYYDRTYFGSITNRRDYLIVGETSKFWKVSHQDENLLCSKENLVLRGKRIRLSPIRDINLDKEIENNKIIENIIRKYDSLFLRKAKEISKKANTNRLKDVLMALENLEEGIK